MKRDSARIFGSVRKRELLSQKKWLITLALLGLSLFQAGPIFYVVALAFKQGSEVFLYPPRFFPQSLSLANFKTALEVAPLGRFLENSFLAASGITFLQMVTSVCGAFALARRSFAGKKIVETVLILTMMIPGEVTLIPNYFLMARWHWLDTFGALIVPFTASGFGVFLLVQFFKSVPKELEEAALLDGCTSLRFLWQIMIPLSVPVLLAFGIYAFVNAYNQYLWPLIVTQSTDMQTVQIGIGMFRSQNEALSWGVIMAATTLLLIPTVLLFMAVQKHLIEGIASTGIKG